MEVGKAPASRRRRRRSSLVPPARLTTPGPRRV